MDMVIQSEVLIVGAGPVGLSLALMLHKLGLQPIIIDEKIRPTTTSNAIAINSRTLEIFETLGILDEVLNQGLKLDTMNYYVGNKKLQQIKLDNIKSKFNYIIALAQSQTEQILIDKLSKVGIAVNWDTKAISCEDKLDSVSVNCQTKNGKEQIIANWVIACDGYHGIIRELSHIPRKCHDLSQRFVMIDGLLSSGVAFGPHISFHPWGPLLMIPMRDKIRVIVEISNDPKYKELKNIDEKVFKELVSVRYPGLEIKRIDWLSRFYVHECLVNQYMKGRIILAGDAAHTHSPAGGQGMNTGIQDAWNLAWKLAAVIDQQASSSLLGSYEIERREIAQEVLNRSGWLTRIITSPNKLVQLIRNMFVRYLLPFKLIKQGLINQLSQTDICYNNSKLVNRSQVLANNQTRYLSFHYSWHVLSDLSFSFFGDALPDFIIHTKLKSKDIWWNDKLLCLVRPDGYIAGYMNNLVELKDYFNKIGYKV